MIKLKNLLNEVSEKSFTGVLYHGSDARFNIKDIRLPAHFGTKAAAKEIGGKYLYKAQITIKHPIRMYDDQVQIWDLDTVGGTLKKELKISEEEINNYYQDFGAEMGLVKLLHKYKYDGIVYENRYEDVGNDSYIVFYHNQIEVL